MTDQPLKPYPVCAKCKHQSPEYIQIGNTARSVAFCHHPAFVDPIGGGALPCKDIRSMDGFCGLKGRGFEAAAEDLPEIKPNLVVVKD